MLSHSEISGSKIAYISPKHIVVCHVLHQLLMPRHPPCALINLTTYYILIWWVRFLNINKIVNYSKILLHVYIARYKYIQSHYQVFKEQLLYNTYTINLRNLNDLSKLSKITFMFSRKVLREGLILYLNLQNDIFYKTYSIERRWSIPTFP